MKMEKSQFTSILYSNVFLLGIAFITCLLLFDFMKRRKTCSRFPQGPRGVLFLGNILQVDFKNPHITFSQLSKKFGNIFSLQYFWTKIVVFNGFEVMKEVLINRSEEIADRPRLPLYDKIGYGGESKGLVLVKYGSSWREQRRFTLSTLRNFGMGKKSLEERVTEEAQCLCSVFKSQKGHPFDPHFLINNAVSNVICSIAFGDRYEYDDPKFQRLLRLFNTALKAESGLLAQILNEVPWLMNISWLVDHVLQPEYELLEFLKEIVLEHKKSWNPNYIRDYIDAYILEMEKVKDTNSSFTEANLLSATMDLFGAGSETTTTTLRWSLLYMLLYPDAQCKVHEEIDRVIGRARKPTMGDMLEMPYTNAVIHEIQRCGDILPLGLPHMTYRDMEIQGHVIPKGTTIITNLSSVLKDKQVWEKPLQFYPKHFLDENGKFVKREAFMSFSAGRRSCLGEQLARMEFFLFFTTLLQQFTFEIPSDQPRPREDAFYAFTLSPYPYDMCAISRI